MAVAVKIESQFNFVARLACELSRCLTNGGPWPDFFAVLNIKIGSFMTELSISFVSMSLFFSCVKDAIRQLFSTDSSETSVRLQVCNVICLLVTTIHQIYAVFYAGDGDFSQPGMLSVFYLNS